MTWYLSTPWPTSKQTQRAAHSKIIHCNHYTQLPNVNWPDLNSEVLVPHLTWCDKNYFYIFIRTHPYTSIFLKIYFLFEYVSLCVGLCGWVEERGLDLPGAEMRLLQAQRCLRAGASPAPGINTQLSIDRDAGIKCNLKTSNMWPHT